MTARCHQWNRGVAFGGPDLPIVVVKRQIKGGSEYSSPIANSSQ
jgi:hypothetical protein